MPLRAGTHPWLVISVTGRSSPPLTDADQTCIWPPWLLRKSTRVRSTDSCGQSPPSPVKRTAAPPSIDAFQMDSGRWKAEPRFVRSEEHTSDLQSRFDLVCRILLEKKKK